MSSPNSLTIQSGRERGIALITVILLLLVLTVLGITASVMMTQEDRTSSRQDQQRAALYAAEAGLRRGEVNLRTLADPTRITTLLAHSPTSGVQLWSSASAPVLPIAGDPRTWDVNHLGTYMLLINSSGSPGTTELTNQEVPYVGGGAVYQGTKAFYTLYVRNNTDDLSGNVTTDSDSKLRLISVGFVTSSGAQASGDTLTGTYTVLAVKILEEEYSYSGVTQSPSLQKQVNAGGTGSILFGG